MCYYLIASMPGKIIDRTIQEIRDRVDIVDLVSEYVTLKKSGRSFSGLCPFHSEKTPSFTVDRAKGLFYCFGCQKGGDVFKFLMEIERLSFSEAAERLAERAGIEIEREASGVSDGLRSLRQRLIELNALAAKYYSYVLNETKTGERGRTYLSDRAFTRQTMGRFNLGFAPSGWSHFTEFATKKGYTREELLTSGLAIKGKKGLYDRFRDRIIFPIVDVQGRVIAFGGRVTDKSLPKYMNSPESQIYSKGSNLYGLFQAKSAISSLGVAAIFEGYTDVILMHQSGVENSVASLGTALTEKQIRLISKFADKVVLVFDSDTAGNAAAMRGLELGNVTDVDISVAELPVGLDPADYIGKHSKEDFAKLIAGSIPVVEYKLKKIIEARDISKPGGKEKVLDEATEMLANLESPIIREEYLGRLFDSLNLSRDGMAHALNLMKRKSGSSRGAKFDGVLKSMDEIERIERHILSILAIGESGTVELEALIEADDFTLPLHREVFLRIAGGKESSRKRIKDDQDPVEDYITGLIVEGSGPSDFRHLVLRIKEQGIKKQADILSKRIDEAEEKEKPSLLKMLRELEDERKRMKLEIRKMIEYATLEEF